MLYRRERKFPAWLAALIAAVVVFPIAFFVGRGTAPSPELGDLLMPSVQAVRSAEGALDIVALEYARATDPDTDAQGALASGQAALAAARKGAAELERARDLASINPAGMESARAAFRTLVRALEDGAEPSDVLDLKDSVATTLDALVPAL